MKGHEIAALVNRLTAIAKEFGQTQQLRERIAYEIRPMTEAAIPDGYLTDKECAIQAWRSMKEKEAARRTALPAGMCPECDGEGEQGGQFTGGSWTCEACAGTGVLAIGGKA